MKKIGLLLLFLVILFGVVFFLPKNKKTIIIFDTCKSLKDQKDVFDRSGLLKIEDGNNFLIKHSSLPFSFKIPDFWNMQEFSATDLEEPIAFPKPKFTILFTYPNGGDGVNWEKGQKSFIKFSAYDDQCKKINEWLDLLPKNKNTEIKEISVNNSKGFLVKTEDQNMLRGWGIVNSRGWHYQFLVEVNDNKEYKKIYDEFAKIVLSLKD